jgi:hypothetical protein
MQGLTGLAKLDQDILEAEQRLAELRAMRKSVKSIVDKVTGVFQTPGVGLDQDDVLEALKLGGTYATRESVRNALYYAVRSGRLTKHTKRGYFTVCTADR